MRVLFVLILLVASACGSRSSEKVKEGDDMIVGDRSAVCFVYHRFGDDRYPSTNVSLADFGAHLEYLKNNGFTVMALSDAIKYLKSGDTNKKVAVLTIDDGYDTFLSGAMPLLKKYGYPATLFINTETVGSGSYLNWEELKKLSQDGIEIGNHSHSHAYFLNTPKEQRVSEFKEDVDKAQELIKEHLKLEPKVFAYPYGEYSVEMKQAIEEMGFIAATAQNSGVMYSQGDYFALPRFPMASTYAAINGFREKARMAPLKLRAEEPESTLLTENPPHLEVRFMDEDLDVSRLQCFVQGGSCNITTVQEQQTLTINVSAKNPLKRRRVLYTITVPSKKGKWHWYSHLWVQPGIKE